MPHLYAHPVAWGRGVVNLTELAVGVPGGYHWLEMELLLTKQSLAQPDPVELLPRPRSLQPTPILPTRT